MDEEINENPVSLQPHQSFAGAGQFAGSNGAAIRRQGNGRAARSGVDCAALANVVPPRRRLQVSG
jgi:hypothetical protein